VALVQLTKESISTYPKFKVEKSLKGLLFTFLALRLPISMFSDEVPHLGYFSIVDGKLSFVELYFALEKKKWKILSKDVSNFVKSQKKSR